MTRTSFLGRESLGNDEPSPKVPDDSPRHYGNRNGAAERRSDEALAKLTPRLVRDPNGHVVKLPRDQPLKMGWVVVDPADIDTPRTVPDGFGGEYTGTARDGLLAALDYDAHELRPEALYYTGRVVFEEGDGFIRQTTTDADVAVPFGAARSNPFTKEKK